VVYVHTLFEMKGGICLNRTVWSGVSPCASVLQKQTRKVRQLHLQAGGTSLSLNIQRLFCRYRIHTSSADILLFAVISHIQEFGICICQGHSLTEINRTTHELTQVLKDCGLSMLIEIGISV